jgi:hypothetical protein
MPRLGFAFSAAVSVIGLAAPHAAAQAVDFFVGDKLNTDSVVNLDADPPTPFDEDNDPAGNLATNFAFLSQSAAVAAGCPSPAGLPDDGFFPANADHPDVHLSFSGGSGLNTRRSNGAEFYNVTTGAGGGHFSAVHVFFASGDGNTTVSVILSYFEGGPSGFTLTVPSWLGPAVPPAYSLFDGGDRIAPDAPFSCDDANTAAIFGYNLPANPNKTLAVVSIERKDNTTAVLNFFGATGLLAVPVRLERFTVE